MVSNQGLYKMWITAARVREKSLLNSGRSKKLNSILVGVFSRAKKVWIASTRHNQRVLFSSKTKRKPPFDLQVILQQIQKFPTATKALYQDYQTSRLIAQAVETSQHSRYSNAWTVNGQPRFARELERQLRRDLKIVLPTLLVFAIPIVGYLAPILSIFFPRQMLSHHFMLNPIQLFREEYQQRSQVYKELILEHFTRQTDIQSFRQSNDKELLFDDARPVSFDVQKTWNNCIKLQSLDRLTRQYLILLILSSGSSKLPNHLASMLYSNFVPTFIIKSILRKLGADIVRDDADLLRSKVIPHSNVELSCLLRGLWPSDNSSFQNMLQYHLDIMAQVDPSAWPSNLDDQIPDALIIFALHLAPLQYTLEKLKT